MYQYPLSHSIIITFEIAPNLSNSINSATMHPPVCMQDVGDLTDIYDM